MSELNIVIKRKATGKRNNIINRESSDNLYFWRLRNQWRINTERYLLNVEIIPYLPLGVPNWGYNPLKVPTLEIENIALRWNRFALFGEFWEGTKHPSEPTPRVSPVRSKHLSPTGIKLRDLSCTHHVDGSSHTMSVPWRRRSHARLETLQIQPRQATSSGGNFCDNVATTPQRRLPRENRKGLEILICAFERGYSAVTWPTRPLDLDHWLKDSLQYQRAASPETYLRLWHLRT